MYQRPQSYCNSNNAVSATITIPGETPPIVPIIKVEVELTIDENGGASGVSRQNLFEWFDWNKETVFTCPSAVLVCRDARSLNIRVGEGDSQVIGTMVLYLSVHPLCSTTIDQARVRAELGCALSAGLRAQLKPSINWRNVTVAVKSDQFDPGVLHDWQWRVNSSVRSGINIVLDKSYDWEVKTCYLSGEHFYPPAPLGFFYEGDLKKPVAPHIAVREGFTINRTVLRGIVAALNSAECLVRLRRLIGYVDHREDLELNLNQGDWETPTYKWGGHIDDSYTWYAPAIDPKDIDKVIEDASRTDTEAAIKRYESSRK